MKSSKQHLLALQDKTVADLVKLVVLARVPTLDRVSALETENDALKSQLARAKTNQLAGEQDRDSDEEDARARAEAAARQKEAEVAVVPNPIHEYVEMLEEEVCCAVPCNLKNRKSCAKQRAAVTYGR